MITTGDGHKAPAEAIRAGIERLYPDRFAIDVLDFSIAVGNPTFDKLVKNSWDWLLDNPKVAYWGQRWIDNVVPVKITRFGQGKIVRRVAKNSAKYVVEQNYSLMISTHYLILQALAKARRKKKIDIPLVGINTDPFNGYALWAEKHLDEMIVTSQRAKNELIEFEVPAEKISIFGYPLGLQFIDYNLSKQEARAKLGLKDKFTIFQSSGGEGIGGQLEEFVKATLGSNLDLQHIVACGRNEQLLNNLKAISKKYKTKTKLLAQGFINNMPDWLAASDLVLGKAGAASTFEPLALGRPIFHTSYVAYNEKANIIFCEENNLSKYIGKPGDLVEFLEAVIKNRSILDYYVNNIKSQQIKPGTLEIAKHLVTKYLNYEI